MRWNIFAKNKKKNQQKRQEALTSLTLIQMSVYNLRVGMYVSKLDIPWLESSFTFQGFHIDSEQDLQKLRTTCQYVYIDTYKQKYNSEKKLKSPKIIEKPGRFLPAPKRLGTFSKEITKAASYYKDAGVMITNFMDQIPNGKSIDAKLAEESVATCVNSILHSPDAFFWLSQLKEQDKYTAQHSLNVSILSIILGRHLGLQEQQLNHLGLCGMMHDMGKMRIPSAILNKTGKLEPEEWDIMKSHTTLGHELLESSDHMFYGAIETALTHHEHMDGSGYPRNLNTNKLSFYSNIVAIADMYDAITSDRSYQKGRTHHEATKIMLNVSGSHLDADLVIKCIESFGIYPSGSFVELNNGCIALVIEENSQFQLRPKILLILDKNKNKTSEKILDLAKIKIDSSNEPLNIKAIIRPDTYQIDDKKYYLEGIAHKGFTKK